MFVLLVSVRRQRRLKWIWRFTTRQTKCEFHSDESSLCVCFDSWNLSHRELNSQFICTPETQNNIVVSSSSTFSSCSQSTSTLFSCHLFSLPQPPHQGARACSSWATGECKENTRKENRKFMSTISSSPKRRLTSTSSESTCRIIIEFQVRKCENNIYHLFRIHNILLKAPNCITIEGALCQLVHHIQDGKTSFRAGKLKRKLNVFPWFVYFVQKSIFW